MLLLEQSSRDIKAWKLMLLKGRRCIVLEEIWGVVGTLLALSHHSRLSSILPAVLKAHLACVIRRSNVIYCTRLTLDSFLAARPSTVSPAFTTHAESRRRDSVFALSIQLISFVIATRLSVLIESSNNEPHCFENDE